MIHVTRPVSWLRRYVGWRSHPRRILEVKELCHIHLRRIPLRQAGQFEPGFHELEPGGVVRHGVGDEILFSEGRDDNQRYAIPRINKIASRTRITDTDVRPVGRRTLQQIVGLDAVGTRTEGSGLGRHVIVESAELVKRENEGRIFPR